MIFLFTIICYLLTSILPILAIYRQYFWSRPLMLTLIGLALFFHGLILHQSIDLISGQNLNFFNMLSFSIWLIGLLIWIVVLRYQVDLLISFIGPLAAISICLIGFFPGISVIDTLLQPQMLFHILFSVLTFCVLSLAALLAMLIALEERLLRFNKVVGLIEGMPSLQTLEMLLFRTVAMSFFLLTIVLITSFYSYHQLLSQNWLLLQKSGLVVIAWMMLLVLLIGRYLHGWRGRKAIYYTLTGMLLLLIAYGVSKFLW